MLAEVLAAAAFLVASCSLLTASIQAWLFWQAFEIPLALSIIITSTSTGIDTITATTSFMKFLFMLVSFTIITL